MADEKTKMKQKVMLNSITVKEESGKKGVCKQIQMFTDIGKITFSPKDFVTKTRINEQGLRIEENERENSLIADLPAILVNMNNACQNKPVYIELEFTQWKTKDAQGEDVVYNFVASMNDFKNIKILG